MGQQQLLLVILVTIIVGIATVVAINTFGSAADSAAQDSVRQDLASIAASAQGYYMRPEMLGGGGRTFERITFNNIAFGGNVIDAQNAENENGTYTMPEVTGEDDDFIVTAIVNDTNESEIQARVCADGMVMGEIGGGAPDNCDGSPDSD